MSNAAADQFWDSLAPVPSGQNEAAVEHHIVLPLLAALGYQTEDIRPKVAVSITQGTKMGRPFEADFVVYSGAIHDEDTSLMVVEAKKPDGALELALGQAESYTHVLKTPAVLLTNGQKLQVWQYQPVMKSKMVFESDIADLKARRGELEQLISKQALIAYSASISFKKLSPVPDFGAYENAELVRTADADSAVTRTLERDPQTRIESGSLLADFPSGAVISAPSGYGKTVLCACLARMAIKARWNDPSGRVVVQLLLADFAETGLSLPDYLFRRIEAHQAGLSAAATKQILRDRGVVVACDGYERVAAAKRPWVDAQLRDFLRDYPRSQLFVFSRGSVVPELPVARLHLLPLTDEQQHEIAKTAQDTALRGAPRLLVDLCKIPLLLRLVLDYRAEFKATPNRLEELFQHWLDQLLKGAPNGAAAAARREQVLALIASELAKRSLLASEALGLVSQIAQGDTAFDELVEAGVLLISEGRVEPVHDGLADFVCAQALSRLEADALAGQLQAMQIDGDSLLPVLLASLVEEPAARKIVWEKLRVISLPRYIDAVRFGERLEAPVTTQPDSDSVQAFLAEMLAGFEGIAAGFFPQIKRQIYASSVYGLAPVDAVRLFGTLGVGQRAQLSYTLVASEPNEPSSAEVGWPENARKLHGIDLTAASLGMGSGRYLGVALARDSIFGVIQARSFLGGPLLANERTIGRIRFLHRAYGVSFSHLDTLEEIAKRFEPSRDKVAFGSTMDRHPDFEIASLLEDVELLRAAGKTHLDWWWLPFGGTDQEIQSTEGQTVGFVKAHYERSVALYREIVDASFPGIARQLPLRMALPVRWELAVVPGRHFWSSVYWQWLPVASEQEAVVQCQHSPEVPETFLRDFDTRHTELTDGLRRLGRDLGHYPLGGFRRLPSVGPADINGRFTGETSVMREAARWIAEEMKALFADLPQHGPGLRSFGLFD